MTSKYGCQVPTQTYHTGEYIVSVEFFVVGSAAGDQIGESLLYEETTETISVILLLACLTIP